MNTSTTERHVTVHLNHLPFKRGELQLFRIDKANASYLDNPASENLSLLQNSTFSAKSPPSWQGTVPGESVVYLRLLNTRKRTSVNASFPGAYVRSYHWFPRRDSDSYADFDTRTWTGRVGMGTTDLGTAEIGNVIDLTSFRLRVKVSQSGRLAQLTRNSLFVIRLDFQTTSGSYNHAVVFHSGLYDAARDTVLPWDKGGAGAGADRVETRSAMNIGKEFEIDVARLAPSDWNKRRIILTLILQDAGHNAWAKVQLSEA